MAVPESRFFRVSALGALSTVLALLIGCSTKASSTPPPVVQMFQLTVVPPAPGMGTVTSSPPGIDCPTTCSANFPENTTVKLTATPKSNHVFDGWKGACSGTGTCRITMSRTRSVTAAFAAGGGGAGKNVIAYVFTPDGLTLTTPEFALLANGQLRATNNVVQPWLMAGTAQGLVVDVPGPNGSRWPTGNLQSYALEKDGTLRARGSPVSFPVDKYASSLASDPTYVYTVSDEGVFGFEDTSTGLTPLPPIQQGVSRPCTSAEENSNECIYRGSLILGTTNALFLESAAWQTGTPTDQISGFTRSQGELTGERLLTLSPPLVEAIGGNFAYALTNGASGASISLCNFAGDFTCSENVLSNGGSLSDGFAQLLVSGNGSFLFAVVFDGSAAPRVRVFRINPSSGALTEIPGSPFLTGEYYFQFAMIDPSGCFLLVLSASCDGSGPCSAPGELAAMSINSTTGELAVTGSVEDGQDPYTIYAVQMPQ